MNSKNKTKRNVAFLRGINVGGHHKVPMADLRKEFESLGFKNVITLLNSGNIVFDAISDNLEKLEEIVALQLEKSFGFSIPTMIREFEMLSNLYNSKPFKDIKLTKETRLYVSFLKKDKKLDFKLPWLSLDNSYTIIDKVDKTILSVLDLSVSKTPKSMEILERYFGSNITTRNWNTIERTVKKL